MGLLFVSKKKYDEVVQGKEEALLLAKDAKKQVKDLREKVENLEAQISTKNIALDGMKNNLKLANETIKMQDKRNDSLVIGNKHLIREISKANAMAYQIFKIIEDEDTKVTKKELRELALILRPRKSTNEKILKMVSKGEKANEDIACS